MFKQHEQIVLTDDAWGDEGQKLRVGDVGCVIHVHSGRQAYVVEFLTLNGETSVIATVLPSQARCVTSADLTHARAISETAGI